MSSRNVQAQSRVTLSSFLGTFFQVAEYAVQRDAQVVILLSRRTDKVDQDTQLAFNARKSAILIELFLGTSRSRNGLDSSFSTTLSHYSRALCAAMERSHRVKRSADAGRKERNVEVVACSICGSSIVSARQLCNYGLGKKEVTIDCSG
ncbi:hypothetical protein EAE99_001870 [Botrytis elliptica]|nr:hypothetical protein EAE99_001870 [Botrytis elliptica]